jgi:hypothetical protein
MRSHLFIAFVFDLFALKLIVWGILVKGDLQLLLLSTSGMSLCSSVPTQGR